MYYRQRRDAAVHKQQRRFWSWFNKWRQNLQNESNHSEESGKKRRKVVSQKGKLLADIFHGREERLQILKRMAEKTEEAGSHDPLFTFFRSMAQTVTQQFPPSIIAETRWKFVSWLRKWKQKLYMSKIRRELRVFRFTVFFFFIWLARALLFLSR